MEEQDRGRKRAEISPVDDEEERPESRANKRRNCCYRPDIRETADVIRCITCGKPISAIAAQQTPSSLESTHGERDESKGAQLEDHQLGDQDAVSVSESATLSHELNGRFSRADGSMEFVALQTNKKEIRILVLEPGTPEQPLAMSIAHASLGSSHVQPEDYEAISYTWADENGHYIFSRTVRCGAHEVSVTKNCEAVLRRLRLEKSPRRIWIDQLCINQSDLAERGHQVGLMPEIYSRASQVLIFLGENTDYAGLAFSSANDFAAKQSTVPGNLSVAPPSWSPLLNETICRLLKCSWFTRVWVLQEVACASKAYLLSSKASVSWSEFRAFIDSWHAELQALAFQDLTADGQIMIPSKLPGALNINLRHSAQPHELLDLLVSANDCNAGDPRDKVFALYGVVLSAHCHGLVADYRKSPKQVFIDTAWFTIRQLRALRVLSYATGGHSTTLNLPSWVPDWSTGCGRPLNEQLKNIHEGNWSSSFRNVKPLCIGNPVCDFANSANSVILTVRGRCLGSVARMVPPESSGRRPSGGSQLPPNLQSCLRCAVKLGAVIAWAQSHHHMFHTESSAGFSINKADIGDQIWQFDGADVLFVCRPSQNGMILISECYLWGFSYHECCQWEPCRSDEAVGCNHCSGFRHTPVMSTLLH